MVLVVLCLAGIFVLQQAASSRSVHLDAVKVLAGASAVAVCHISLDQALADFVKAATDPTDARHAKLLESAVRRANGRLDPSIPAAAAGAPALEWKRPSSRRPEPVGTVAAEPVALSLEGLQPFASTAGVADGDECTGFLRSETATSVQLGGASVRRRLVEWRQVKVALTGPPRPFDQLGFYHPDLSKLTDPREANRLCREAARMMDVVRARLASPPSGLSTASSGQVAAILAGLPDLSRSHLPVLPEEPAVVLGLAEAGGRVDLAALDVAAALRKREAEMSAALAAFQSAPDSGFADGGVDWVGRTTRLLRVANKLLHSAFLFSTQFRVLPRSGTEFARLIGPYQARLERDWFDPRVMIQLKASGEAFSGWLAGRRELDGVFRVHSDAPLTVSGPAAGRCVLVLDAPSVSLRNLGADSGTDEMVTLVVTRGSVTVTGDVRACLIASGDAQVTFAHGAHLTGGLLIASRNPAPLTEGVLSRDAACTEGARLDDALAGIAHGKYALAASPAPLFTEGDRR